ncbi:MAG: TIGR02206 family membrane protein [Verrucomicrobiae bacterium]|nr:TIGR02206 family membrane protein [Verrucomicrobiae bacterium]NNJ87709.1 TIGR02206 family membrane protein [Akkermansiaceae bacterium]
MLAAFELYGFGHVGALICLAAVAVLVIRRCRKNEYSARAKSGITLLTFCCFAAYPINQAAWESIGGTASMTAIVPFHLCDVAAFLCGFALITRRPLLCELSYFWGLAGTLQGLLTPNLPYDFPHPVFIAFFMQHGVIVITALLLPLGLGWRPRGRAWLHAFGWILVYAMAAIVVNLVLGTNFGFLMHKPSEASLLDIMPAWPGYVFCLIGLAALMFYLLGLPFKNTSKKK